MSAPADLATLTQFVYDEARLIDEKRFEEWYELFTDDAYYWMPLTRGQPDGDNHTSLLYEDKLLLRVRIDRLKNPQLEAANRDGAGWVTRTPFLYLESQLDTQQVLAGVSRLHLVQLDGRLRIRLKKVELLNCDAALPSIQLFP
jgi:hypothetical protein